MSLDEITNKLNATKVGGSGTLSFAGRGLKLDTVDDAKQIAEEIKNFKDLTALELSGNTLGVDAAKEIGKALESQPKLTHALWRDMFTGRLKQEIPKALNFLGSGLMLASAQLIELDLSDNAFGPIGIEGILSLLRSSVCYSLEELKLNNNGLGIGGGKALASSLLDCYKSSVKYGKPFSLKVFVCGRNRLEDDAAIALAEVFETVGTLENITMIQNGIRHKGISAIASALSSNPNLHTINFNDNIFTEVGAEAMAKAIPLLKKLRSINFGDCLTRTRGAEIIAKALMNSHEALEELNLTSNEINVDGGLAIVECLKNKKNLKKLEIDSNEYGQVGIEAMTKKLIEIEKFYALTPDKFMDDDGDLEDDDYENEEDDDDDNEDVEDIPQSQTNEATNDKVTIEEFLAAPNMIAFAKLQTNIVKNVLDHLEGSKVEKYIECFMKVSQLVPSTGSNECEKLTPLTEALMRQACDLSKLNSTALTNAILCHLDLIKNEDKGFKVAISMQGAFVMLSHSMEQDYFPKSVCRTIKFFLTSERNVKKLDDGGDELLKAMEKLSV